MVPVFFQEHSDSTHINNEMHTCRRNACVHYCTNKKNNKTGSYLTLELLRKWGNEMNW